MYTAYDFPHLTPDQRVVSVHFMKCVATIYSGKQKKGMTKPKKSIWLIFNKNVLIFASIFTDIISLVIHDYNANCNIYMEPAHVRITLTAS